MSSLECREDTTEKIEEAIDYVNDRLPSDDSSTPLVRIFTVDFSICGSALNQDPLMIVRFF